MIGASADSCRVVSGISLRDISVSFKGQDVFSHAFLEAKRGDVIGFMGPNGSGKSTMLGVLAGLIVPRHGEGEVLGFPLGKACHVPFGMMPETPPFVDDKAGFENLMLLARLKGIAKDGCANQCRSLMKRVGLDTELTTPVRGYSQGMRKRLGLAQALLGSPPLYLLDEPMNGLDPIGVIMMRDCIRACADCGAIVIVSSHLLDELERVCTRVYMFNDGEVVPVTSKRGGAGWLERVYVDSVLGNAR